MDAQVLVKRTISKVTVAFNNTASLLSSINLAREVYFNE